MSLDYASNRQSLINLIHSAQSLLTQLSECKSIEFPCRDESSIESYPLTVLSLNITVGSLSAHHMHTIVSAKLRDATLHLDKLLVRILDVKSRVLVTGDVNAGKSTFVNAMLRRDIVPDDQQPCTNVFAEVIDADQNDSVEEVHGVRYPEKYDKTNPKTFDRIDLMYLRENVEENVNGYKILVYCNDCRPMSESLLKNGIVHVQLIDSPGLNISTIATMSLFAKQEEIDVVVFLVNAENHFTLSGKEFLEIAGREKGMMLLYYLILAYIFFVVNKFDLIKRRERCQVEILNQIKLISPTSYRESLVHFVSARHSLDSTLPEDPDFIKLEHDLRSFILTRRTLSKLFPIKTYIQNLLQDVNSITTFNSRRIIASLGNLEKIQRKNGPIYDALCRIKEEVILDTEAAIHVKCVALGERLRPAVDGFVGQIGVYVGRVEWTGLLSFGYSKRVKDVIKQLACLKMQHCTILAQVELLENVGELETTAFRYFDRGKRLLDDLGAKTAFDDAGELEMPLKLWRWRSVLGSVCVGAVLGVSGMLGFVYADFRIRSIASQDIFLALTSIGSSVFVYGFASLQRSIRHQVTATLTNHFKSLQFADLTIDRYQKSYKRSMRNVYWEFSREFGNTFDRVSKIKSEVGSDVDKIKDSELIWSSLSQDCATLFSTVNRLKM